MEVDMPEDSNGEKSLKSTRRNSENFKKRLSQIELEINEMNDLLTENIDMTQKMMIDQEDSGATEDAGDMSSGPTITNEEKEKEPVAIDGKKEEKETKAYNDAIEHSVEAERPPTKQADGSSWSDVSTTLPAASSPSNGDLEDSALMKEILDTPFNFSHLKSADAVTSPHSATSSSYSHSSDASKNGVKSKIQSIEAINSECSSPKSSSNHQESGESVPTISNYKRDNLNAFTTDNASNSLSAPRILSNSVKSPFRVISVSKVSGHSSTSFEKSNDQDTNTAAQPATQREAFIGQSGSQKAESTKHKKMTVSSLQLVYEHLDNKIQKVEKEIDYLQNIMVTGGLNLADSKKLKEGIQILENYLDSKVKLRYEIGVKLSRKLRHRIELGKNEEVFFSGKI
ncbi:Bud neck protein 5 [Hanseniaspora osmophila]|uniref:Bud neck protein 5 n=1 Tax=Hanseniaspora osmophila TaxID=56408 RepID=A0A1E5RNE9_9ASCO|nr:Bud neck protein 5 [Hanseniaspora osmophila]